MDLQRNALTWELRLKTSIIRSSPCQAPWLQHLSDDWTHFCHLWSIPENFVLQHFLVQQLFWGRNGDGTGSPNHSFIQLWVGLVPYGHSSSPITVWTRGWENPVLGFQLPGKDTFNLICFSLKPKLIRNSISYQVWYWIRRCMIHVTVPVQIKAALN